MIKGSMTARAKPSKEKSVDKSKGNKSLNKSGVSAKSVKSLKSQKSVKNVKASAVATVVSKSPK